MQKKIHKQHLIQSNTPHQEENTITQEVVSKDTHISTEVWESEPTREWIDAGVVTAKKGYKWITKWESGKNYITTKIIDEKDNLVGFYWDITSQVIFSNKQFQAYDWYLDIFITPNNEIFLLDEVELELALEAKFIDKDQARIAKETAKDVIKNIFDLMF